jgi:hypothetical protein
MDIKMFELALIYGAYDYDHATEIKSFMFSTKRELKETLKIVLESEDTDLYKIETSVNLVDIDNDYENLTYDMICEIDYQKYLEHKEFIEEV